MHVYEAHLAEQQDAQLGGDVALEQDGLSRRHQPRRQPRRQPLEQEARLLAQQRRGVVGELVDLPLLACTYVYKGRAQRAIHVRGCTRSWNVHGVHGRASTPLTERGGEPRGHVHEPVVGARLGRADDEHDAPVHAHAMHMPYT